MLATRRLVRMASSLTRKGSSWMMKRRVAKGLPCLMEKRMARTCEMLWSRKEAEAPLWRVATKPQKMRPNPMASSTLSTQSMLTLSYA